MKLKNGTFIRLYNRLKPAYRPDRVASLCNLDANGRVVEMVELTAEDLKEVFKDMK